MDVMDVVLIVAGVVMVLDVSSAHIVMVMAEYSAMIQKGVSMKPPVPSVVETDGEGKSEILPLSYYQNIKFTRHKYIKMQR